LANYLPFEYKVDPYGALFESSYIGSFKFNFFLILNKELLKFFLRFINNLKVILPFVPLQDLMTIE